MLAISEMLRERFLSLFFLNYPIQLLQLVFSNQISMFLVLYFDYLKDQIILMFKYWWDTMRANNSPNWLVGAWAQVVLFNVPGAQERVS